MLLLRECDSNNMTLSYSLSTLTRLYHEKDTKDKFDFFNHCLIIPVCKYESLYQISPNPDVKIYSKSYGNKINGCLTI